MIWKELGFTPGNIELYENAFTHRSYVNENPDASSYERLEFIGDSVLQLLVTEYIWKKFPDMKEGKMTELRQITVRTESIAKYALQLGLNKFVKTGKGEKDASREGLMADVFEAFLGALFIDNQHEVLVSILTSTAYKAIDDEEFEDALTNYKARLQELIQADNRGDIKYSVLSEEGPDHNKFFEVKVELDDICLGKGTGISKKIAENMAAKDALSKLSLK